MISHPNWIFLTVGVGSTGFERAADRLSKGIEAFDCFGKVLSIKTRELREIMPEIQIFNPDSTRGFGFYAWKPKLTRMVLEGYWGKFDGICFADAGCETNPNFLSRLTLSKRLAYAESMNFLAYAISTAENQMTKQGVLDIFPESLEHLPEYQFQSGTYYLFGNPGVQLAHEWETVCWQDPYNINDDTRAADLLPHFVSHRNEQSIFSLLLKGKRIRPFFPHPPGYDRILFPSKTNILEPIWWARNRDGGDKRSIWHKFASHLN